MAFNVQILQQVINNTEPISQRGDFKVFAVFHETVSKRFNNVLTLVALMIAVAMREPDFVYEYLHALMTTPLHKNEEIQAAFFLVDVGDCVICSFGSFVG
jgi:hypothetical protein